MSMGKLVNDNTLPLVDEYKGLPIDLAPGKSMAMDYYDYIDYAGQFPTKVKAADWVDGSGQQKPESFKKIHWDGKIPGEKEIEVKVCAACGEKFPSDTQLDLHIDMNHLDAMEDQDLAEVRRRKRAKAG